MKKHKHKLPKFIDINTFDFTPYGRELTREEAYLVNGGQVMSQADQYAMAQAHTQGDQETMDAIVSKYENKDELAQTISASTTSSVSATSTNSSNVYYLDNTSAKVDDDNKTISFELRDKEGAESAGRAFYMRSDWGYTLNVLDNGKIVETFSSEKAAFEYINKLDNANNFEYNKNEDNNIIVKFADILAGFIIPNGIEFSKTNNNDVQSIFKRKPGTKNLYRMNTKDKPLVQISVGKREALGIGYSGTIGIVVNPNNYWDSGIVLSGGLGMGIEKSAPIIKNNFLTNCLNMAANSVNFTNPTSTSDIEGLSRNVYTSAGLGISSDLNESRITGIQIGSVGGGVYYEGTTVITPGEILEGIYNSGAFILNQVFDNSGMGRFVQLDYIEMDGQ